MVILAIDPGPEESAFVEYVPRIGKPHSFAKWRNEDLVTLDVLRFGSRSGMHLVVEMIASFGMPVGAEVFQTCLWIGRFLQAWNGLHTLVYRKDVKLHLCNSPRANDASIRQALIDRWGGKERAIGNKKQPGPLYGVSGDIWQALAVAVTYADKQKEAA
jgi:hypothetical protein